MAAAIRITPYRDADRPALLAFVAGIQDYERALAPQLKTGAEIAEDHADRVLSRVLEGSGVLLMAREGERPVGFLAAWMAADDDPLLQDAARQHALIGELFVEEAMRRSGIARALLAAGEAAMAARGARRLRIWAKAGNQAAVACYRTFGFADYEVVLEKPIGPDASAP